MTDPLPADVRQYLENMAAVFKDGAAVPLLARYPKPGPVWQPGDMIRWDDQLGRPQSMRISEDTTDFYPEAELIARDGRRVHPARFHDHAEFLRNIAKQMSATPAAAELAAIADDIDPEVSDRK